MTSDVQSSADTAAVTTINKVVWMWLLDAEPKLSAGLQLEMTTYQTQRMDAIVGKLESNADGSRQLTLSGHRICVAVSQRAIAYARREQRTADVLDLEQASVELLDELGMSSATKSQLELSGVSYRKPDAIASIISRRSTTKIPIRKKTAI